MVERNTPFRVGFTLVYAVAAFLLLYWNSVGWKIGSSAMALLANAHLTIGLACVATICDIVASFWGDYFRIKKMATATLLSALFVPFTTGFLLLALNWLNESFLPLHMPELQAEICDTFFGNLYGIRPPLMLIPVMMLLSLVKEVLYGSIQQETRPGRKYSKLF